MTGKDLPSDVNIPFLSSNVPSAQAYGVYVSQLIHHARACTKYKDFIERGKLLTTSLLSLGHQRNTLLAALKNVLREAPDDLVDSYNVVVSRIISDASATDKPWADFQNSGHTFFPTFSYFSRFKRIGMVGEAS